MSEMEPEPVPVRGKVVGESARYSERKRRERRSTSKLAGDDHPFAALGDARVEKVEVGALVAHEEVDAGKSRHLANVVHLLERRFRRRMVIERLVGQEHTDAALLVGFERIDRVCVRLFDVDRLDDPVVHDDDGTPPDRARIHCGRDGLDEVVRTIIGWERRKRFSLRRERLD